MAPNWFQVMAFNDKVRQAALRLNQKLGLQPWFQSVGISGSEDLPFLIVYSRRSSRNVEAIVPPEWEGFTVRVERIGKVIPALPDKNLSPPLSARFHASSSGGFTESVVEDAALAWLESLGYAIKHGPEIAPGELFAERVDYGQVVLAERVRQALVRLNPNLPAEAIEDAFRKMTR